MEEKSRLVTIRPAVADDVNFIFASWLRGLYFGNSFFREIPKNVFMAEYHKVIEAVLKSTHTRIKVACLKDDASVILGYSVSGRNNTLHWVFCKAAWRGIGIAKDLIPKDTKVVTHLTKAGLGMMRKHSEIHFNPFLMN